jgi:predicted DNA-binding transcriptional regulator YafY
MSTNKNAVIRYRVLDACFRNPGKKYYKEDLLEACNARLGYHNGEQSRISMRQLNYDIAFMESESGYKIPLQRIREGKRVYYRYSDLNFSIDNQPLNETEILELQESLRLLSRFKGLPQLEGLEDIIMRLRRDNTHGLVRPVVSFDENPYLRGLSHIGDLFAAILYQKVLRIQYRHFKSPESYAVIFHPYHLKQFNNRWFVLGYNEAEQHSSWNLALDRIEAIAETQDLYRKDDTDWQEFFEDIIGVTKLQDRTPEKIICWFSEDSAPYIITKPLHGSQKKITNTRDSGIMIQLTLIPNFEFYQRILSFGKNVEVLAPDGVVEEIKSILSGALAQYGG